MASQRPAPEVSALSKPLSEVRHPDLLFAVDYWNQKRGTRSMPARADLEPLDFVRLWPHIILIDIRGDDLVVRLVGTAVVALFGSDYTGQRLAEIDFGRQRDTILDQYRHVVDGRLPYIVDQPFRDLQGRLFDMERLILPLSNDDRTVNMLFAVLCLSDMRGLDE